MNRTSIIALLVFGAILGYFLSFGPDSTRKLQSNIYQMIAPFLTGGSGIKKQITQVRTGLKSLEELELDEARFTLPAILQLKALPHLKSLGLRNSLDVPPEDIEKLRKELPGVAIQWKPMTEKDREFLNSMLK